MLASPINPADINQVEGVYPSKPPFTQLLGTPKPSAAAGNEGLCEVISVGEQVQGFKPGDRAVFRAQCFGTWQSHAAVPDEHMLIKVPLDIPVLPAATVSVNPCTAYRLLSDFWSDCGIVAAAEGEGGREKGSLMKAAIDGEWVLQNGANSGAGRAVIQIAKILNLKTLNVVRRGARTAEEVEELRKELQQLGATEVITDEDLGSREIKDKIAQLTNGRGIALGINCVGGRPATDMARNLRLNATLVTYGAMGRQPLTIPSSLLIFNNLALKGFWFSNWAKGRDEEKEKMLSEIFDWMRKGWIQDVPYEEVKWTGDSTEEEVVGAVARAAEGTGPKKVFVFEHTE